ncbi:MAG TPA: phosphoribosylglycinamide formyltransferase [Candidatus Acidoferrales bacterium]|nr:phosphoribosylglycinamide formyltransferase [Candidatus Acidoferrales bacterium]
MRLAVLVSGRGTNLRNLCERGLPVVAVATNRPGCPAAAFARQRGIPLGEFPQKAFRSLEERDLAMRAWLLEHAVEVVVNAGYDRVLSAAFLAGFPGRILNVHPSLLPAFKGTMHAVEEALAAGVKVTGCTVHLVTEDVDGGPILLQAAVPVLEGDTPETLHARIQVEEHRLLPQAIHLIESSVQASSPLR